MSVSYQRTGGRGEPREDERLEIDDAGQFTLWRSTGTPAVGRFAGSLPKQTARELAAAAEAARSAGPLTALSPPDASQETIDLGAGITAQMGHPTDPGGGWGALVGRLRALADELVDRPVAAIGLEVGEEGRSARLVHLGSEAIRVDLGAVRVSAFAWKGYYEPAGRWERGPIALAEKPVTAEPGWSIDLPFDHGLTLGRGRSLQVALAFAIESRGAWNAVSAAHVPVIEPPRSGRKG